MEDLGDDKIVLKVSKPRSQKQIETFEKARAIRLENSILKKEGIEKVKADVKNRNKVGQPLDKVVELKSITTTLPSEVLSEEEHEVIIIKKKKKPKVIYIDGSSDDEPEPTIIKTKKHNDVDQGQTELKKNSYQGQTELKKNSDQDLTELKKNSYQGQSQDLRQIVKEPLVNKSSIRFC